MTIHDLAGLTLECTRLERARLFYTGLFGLRVVLEDQESGVLELAFPNGQTLRFWQPISRHRNDARLEPLGARGGAHVHFALQIGVGTLECAKARLRDHGVSFETINLGNDERPDWGVYFFDPFNHGLELREVRLGHEDAFAPVVPPTPSEGPIPVAGLREVALAFEDFEEMCERLATVYGLPLAKIQSGRDFAQFTLGPRVEPDGNGTPRRWLYAWDVQVGLADMLGGEHVTLSLHADLDPLEARVRTAGLPYLRDEQGLAVRDPSGHIFEFKVPPVNGEDVASGAVGQRVLRESSRGNEARVV
jgi:catechol 2,3-dioxygenase-like lactoylglutathione lyase family enzyme